MKKRSKIVSLAPRALKGNSSGGVGSLVLRKDLETKKISPGKASVFKSISCPAPVAPRRRSGFSRVSQAGEALRASMVLASPSGAEFAHVAAGESVGINVLLGEPVSALGKNPAVSREVGPANASAVESLDLSELLEEPEFVLGKHVAVLSEAAETAVSAHALAGESAGIPGSFQSAECSDVMTLSASGCVASACARRSAAALASLAPASRVSSPAVFAVGSHARFTPMHDARNSCSHTVVNSLRDQRCRKVRWSRTVGNRSVVQTVDMSPAPDAGTYRRSADEVHDQRQISRKRQAVCSVGGPGPGPGTGPGGWSGLVGGSLGLAAAFRGIPCSLVMPPGRHQRAPQSLGWRGYVVPRSRESGC